MVALEQIEALDLLLWLRTGADAACQAICDQSSITRRVSAVLHAIGLQLRRGYELQLLGDLTLIRLPRLVHQQARFLGHRPLRLEATHYIRAQLQNPSIRGWTLGPCHHRGYGTLLGLL